MKKSAGLLLYRREIRELEIFLVHPGGPFWKNKDLGAWSIPKGEFNDDEDGLLAAKREFKEETGIESKGEFLALAPIKQKGGKVIYAWALKMDLDENKIVSNEFEMEWPPKSGRFKSFPEVDRGAWFSIPEAREKINPSQASLIDQLILLL
jgi:predicted NUDIX family NTP pyrophosphohydrolase